MGSQIGNPKLKIVVVGAGPAGSTLSIRLAMRGFAVTLIEKDRFPRQKLCGEFISPECFRHFDELGVRTEMFAKGGDRINETRFFAASGRNVSVPTHWFGHGDFALSLSRAEMDLTLMTKAREVGVEVIEGVRVVASETADNSVKSLTLRSDAGERTEMSSDIFIDASGRSAVLSKFTRAEHADKSRETLVGFKAHLTGVKPEPGVCEIYFFEGGYGGLSHVENDKANFCFLVRSALAKQFIGKTNDLFRSVIARNPRALMRMQNAVEIHDWIGVSVDGFGSRADSQFSNLVSVGDASAFIDPFTGSGMLMAMESAELLAAHVSKSGLNKIGYESSSSAHFRRRLLVSSLLRKAAFLPKAASAAITLASLSDRFRSHLARGTRKAAHPL